MKIIVNAPPAGRKTAVELTDRDIQLITRGLLKDETPSGIDNGDENVYLYVEFANLRESLGLEPIA
jgi:hypothetical protein